MGDPGRLDFRARVMAPRTIAKPPRAPFREVAAIARERELNAGGLLLGRPVGTSVPQAADRRPAAQGRSPLQRELLRPARARNAGHGQAPAARVRRSPTRRSRICPTSAARSSWPRSASAPLAEEMLRHQARICRPSEHHGLIEVAKRLDLAGAQFWLAHNGQPGAIVVSADRYPDAALDAGQRLAGRSGARPMPTSSRNRISAPTPSAPPARSA